MEGNQSPNETHHLPPCHTSGVRSVCQLLENVPNLPKIDFPLSPVGLSLRFLGLRGLWGCPCTVRRLHAHCMYTACYFWNVLSKKPPNCPLPNAHKTSSQRSPYYKTKEPATPKRSLCTQAHMKLVILCFSLDSAALCFPPSISSFQYS